jgi:hypothetical protein
MFYQNDYAMKLIKEQEIRERVQQAAKDRLLIEIRPRHHLMLKQSARALLHMIGHLFLGIGTSLAHVGTGKPTRQPASR